MATIWKLVQYSEMHLYIGPFNKWTCFHHLNTCQVQYLNSHCRLICIGYYFLYRWQFKKNTVGIRKPTIWMVAILYQTIRKQYILENIVFRILFVSFSYSGTY